MKQLAFLLLSCACSIASAADNYSIGSDEDPRVRASDFMAENRRFLAASTTLLEVQKEAPRQAFPPEYFERLADDTLNFGMQKRSEVTYREAAAGSHDPVVVARARLRRAEFLYERGYLPEANAELTSLRQTLPSVLMINWQDQMSRVLMAQDRYAEAVQVLSKPDTASDQSGYMRYNLGIALLHSDHVDEGINILDRVGQRRVIDSEGLALRDKANLTLGYYWLKRQQGGSAIPIFNRIRQQGPYSNRALLGLGWAYLAPDGDKQKRIKLSEDSGSDSKQFSTIGAILRPGFLDTDIYKRAGLRPFQLNRADPSQEAALKKALVPWVELVSRDPIDPAVQEGLLAIPYVLDKLGAHIQAQQYYEKAIAALEQTRVNLDQAILSIRYGRMVDTIISRNGDADSGWTWKLKDLPDAPETFYLQSLLADHPFQEALKNFRDIRLLIRDTDAERQRILDLQAAYDTRVTQSVSPRELQQRIGTLSNDANLGYQPDFRPQLQMAQMLVASPYDDKAKTGDTPAAPPVKLRLPNAPAKFDGPYERLDALKARLDALSPHLKAAEDAGGKLIQRIALNDLDAQRKLNERFLVEARFALARIYDRQAHGDAP